ncbi:hypothetical protein [Chitinophaga sp.]|uniref:hypothetical protein n=1 Tax=Chitinophaga sp. TaxID=1869181 RepID=UPI0031CFEF43
MNRNIIQRLDTHSTLPDGNDSVIVKGKATDKIDPPNYGNETIRRYATDTDLRKHITYSFIINITFWLSAVMSVLYFNNYLLQLHLSDAVLITLLTTSSLNVIGMMTIILKNLFPLQAEKLLSLSVVYSY